MWSYLCVVSQALARVIPCLFRLSDVPISPMLNQVFFACSVDYTTHNKPRPRPQTKPRKAQDRRLPRHTRMLPRSTCPCPTAPCRMQWDTLLEMSMPTTPPHSARASSARSSRLRPSAQSTPKRRRQTHPPQPCLPLQVTQVMHRVLRRTTYRILDRREERRKGLLGGWKAWEGDEVVV